MHVSFDETNTSKEEIVVCDDDIIELPPKEISNDQNVNQPEHQQGVLQQDSNINDLPK